MLKATIKSLLGRKLRLLMSTFAIVLGVAFVGGSLIFSDTLGRSFTALFASTVGDVVVRPADAGAGLGASTVTIPASVVDDLESVPGAARVDGNVTAFGVYVVDKDNKVVGGQGPPAIGGNYSDAPAGHDLPGLALTEGRPPRGPDEVVFDAKTAQRSGYVIGEKVHIVTSSDQALLTPKLVGILDFPEGGSLNGATFAAFDTPTAQDLFLEGEDAYTDIWVTADDGVSQTELRDAVSERLPDGTEAVTGDTAADEAASDLLEAISFLRTFLLIFAGISLVVGAFLIVNTFSILVAQRSRELALLRALGASKRQVTRSVLFEAFLVGVVGSTLGLGLGVLLAMGIRALFANFGLDLTGQALIFAPRTVLACYVVGVLVTMAAAWLPARRTTRIAPVQALRDDIALPETSIHRRLLLGLVGIGVGAAAMGAGLFTDVPRGGWVLGLGILVVLLGVTAVSPVISRPFLAAAQATYRRVFGTVGNLAGQNSLRNPRRTTATASALMIGLALACTMAILGDSAKASVDEAVEENFVGDYIVSSVFGEPFSPTIATKMAEVDGHRPGGPAALGPGRARRRLLRHRRHRPGRHRVPRDPDGAGDAGRLHRRVGARRRGLGRGRGTLGGRHVHAGEDTEGQARAAGGRHLRREPGDLLPHGHHPGDPEAAGLPDRGQRADPRRRPGHRRLAEPPRRGGEGPADRHRQGPGRVRRRAACAHRPAGADDLRPARPGPGHRRARHREHPRALGDRAHPRGRACCAPSV